MGEIISTQECKKRMDALYIDQQNFYFLEYNKGEVIDAGQKGSDARFINHSCDPNCHIEKWYHKERITLCPYLTLLDVLGSSTVNHA